MTPDLDSYWKATHAASSFEKLPPGHYIRQLVEQFIPCHDHAQALEIGCYPGTFLALFGNLGYTLNGIDTYPGVSTMAQTLHEAGYRTGEFIRTDFENWHPAKTFELVSSFGFIEHFDNYQAILQKHIDLLSGGGWLVVGAPNFRYGLQYAFHYLFDRPNLRRHVLKAMDPQGWKKIMEDNGMEILYCDYCGGMQFWMNNDQPALPRWGGRVFMKLAGTARKIIPGKKMETVSNKRLSCYFLVIGRRRPSST